MSYFKAKMYQVRPEPRWGAHSTPPEPLAGFKGATSKEREGRKDGREGDGTYF